MSASSFSAYLVESGGARTPLLGAIHHERAAIVDAVNCSTPSYVLLLIPFAVNPRSLSRRDEVGTDLEVGDVAKLEPMTFGDSRTVSQRNYDLFLGQFRRALKTQLFC